MRFFVTALTLSVFMLDAPAAHAAPVKIKFSQVVVVDTPKGQVAEKFKALGVATVPLPFGQVRKALKIGLVSAQENAWRNIHSRGFYDYQKFSAETRHTSLGYMLVTSKEFWNNTPVEIRDER